MNGGKILESIEFDIRDIKTGDIKTVFVDVHNSSLGRKWLAALNHLLANQYHLEKNYCFVGFPDSERNGWHILEQVNQSIAAINDAAIGYTINDYFDMGNTIDNTPQWEGDPGRRINQDKFNHLHHYFEELQGVSGNLSPFYLEADSTIRWHIRQLNLLCHEFESWVKSYRKKVEAPEWMRPSQLMCWLNAPRFALDEEDYELFGIETINRSLGGVYVGVNKAVGKHHWEVFCDEEGRDIADLTTIVLRANTEAAGDFDIEWANDPGAYEWQKKQLAEFREWLIRNGFDPEDKSLTIGHPQVGQVDLVKSFGTENYVEIWEQLNNHLDVHAIRTSDASATYNYHWNDADYIQQQIAVIERGY